VAFHERREGRSHVNDFGAQFRAIAVWEHFVCMNTSCLVLVAAEVFYAGAEIAPPTHYIPLNTAPFSKPNALR